MSPIVMPNPAPTPMTALQMHILLWQRELVARLSITSSA
jgi:hypothetical protein